MKRDQKIASASASAEQRKEPLQARSKVRFNRILDVATALIAQNGVEPVTMSEIATTAGISIASLYQYFPDKAGIVATLASRLHQEGQTCAREAVANIASADDLIAALHRLIDDYHGCFLHTPGAFAIWQASQSDTRLQALDRADMEAHSDTISGALEKLFTDMTASDGQRLGRLFTSVIGTTVRMAAPLCAEEARALIAACKHYMLSPAVHQIVRQRKACD